MERLSLGLKIRYGVADLGFALLSAAASFFLLYYYTDIAMINPAIAGTALLVGKLTWDAINDPLFGYMSDRTRSRFGRRRVYLLVGAVPLGLAAWLMFSLPANLAVYAAFFVVLGTFLLFDTFHTMTNVPYAAMTAELTHDYSERASLTAVRMIFSVIGYLLGAGATTILADTLASSFGLTPQAAWSVMGGLFGLIATLAILVTAITVKEPGGLEAEPSKMAPVKAVAASFRNRPFVILMGAFIVSSFAFALLTSLVPYFIIYQLDMKDAVPLVLVTMLLGILLFLIPAKRLSDRINKGPAYALGLLIAALAILGTFFLPKGPTPWIYFLAFIAGVGFSGQWVFPWSMLPDVIEVDQLMTGERREGIYFGVWNFVQKFTNAFGIALGGWGLAWFGYIANQPQTDQALLGIRLFFALVPALALMVSLPLLLRYPITRQSHEETLAELARRGESPIAGN